MQEHSRDECVSRGTSAQSNSSHLAFGTRARSHRNLGTLGLFFLAAVLPVVPSAANTLIQGHPAFVYGQFDETYTATGAKLCSKLTCPGTQWVLENTPIPTALADCASAMNSTKVWLAGGFDGTTSVRNVWYATLSGSPSGDPISSWTAGPALPSPVRDHALVAADRFLYALGGRTAGAPRDSILIGEYKFDGTLLGWRPSAVPLPQALWDLKAINLGDRLYTFGGCTSASEQSATDAVYFTQINVDGNLEGWQSAAALPGPRGGHAVAATSGRVWIIGGHDGTGADQATVYYADIDPQTGAIASWQTSSPLPAALRDHGAALQNGTLTVLGGRSGGSVVRTVYNAKIDADLSLTAWTSSGPLRQEVERFEPLRVDGRIYRAGGLSRTGVYLSDAEYTTLVTDAGQSWSYRGQFVTRSIDFRFTPTVNQLAWTKTGTGTVGLRWRAADDDGVWSPWSALSTTSPAAVNQACRYLQYALELGSNGSQPVEATQVDVDVLGLTFVQGNVSGSQTWRRVDTPHLIYAEVAVGSGAALTIEPGVRAYFAWPAGLSVTSGGSVTANGTGTDSISFSSLDGAIGHWKGVSFSSTLPSSFMYCAFEKAGEPWNSVQHNFRCSSTGEPRLEHCVFRWSAGDGLRLSSASTFVESCTFYGNADAGARVSGRWSSGAPIVSQCASRDNLDGIVIESSAAANPTSIQFSDVRHNRRDGIRATSTSTACFFINTVQENTMHPIYFDSGSWPKADCWSGNLFGGNGQEVIGFEGRNITTDREMSALGLPYRVEGGNLVVGGYPAATALRISAGVTIEFASGTGLSVGPNTSYRGALSALGTPEQMIRMKPAPGVTDWKGIYFGDYSDYAGPSSMEYCRITGVNGSWDGGNTVAAVFCNGATTVAIRQCEITRAGQRGVSLTGSTILLEGSRIDSCGTYPVYVDQTSWCDVGAGSNSYHANQTQAFVLAGRTVSADARLVLQEIPYRLLGTWLVYHAQNRPTLTIDAGVTVEFASGAGLQIASSGTAFGQLSALGLPGAWIRFLPAPGVVDWKGLYFADASDYGGAISTLEYCQVVGAGGNWVGVPTNVYCNASNEPTIRNCAITRSAGVGLYLAGSAVHLEASRIDSCIGYPLYLASGSTLGAGSGGNTFTGNEIQAAAIPAQTLAADAEYLRLAIPYRVLGDLSVYLNNGNPALTIDPGVRMEFATGAGLQIGQSANYGGQLQAAGAVDQPIVFAPAPGAADWKGLLFSDGSDRPGATSLLSYCTVQGAGATRLANIRCESTNQPTIQDCLILGGTQNGLYLSQAPIAVIRSLITGNALNGVYTTGTAFTIGGDPSACNRLEGNLGYELRLGSNHDVDATYNWWGSVDESVIRSEIYDRSDNGSLGIVSFSPYSQESCGEWPVPGPFHLTAPANGDRVLTLYPTFDWEDAAGGNGIVYDLEIADNPDFQNALAVQDIATSAYTFTSPLADGTAWFWRVKAENNLGLWRYSTETWTVITNIPPSVPDPIYPIDGSVCVPEWFLVWLESIDQGGSSITYRVQVDDSGDFTSPEIDQAGVAGERNDRENAVAVQLGSLTGANALEPNRDYYWRVQAYDFYPDSSGFSAETIRFHFLARATAVDDATSLPLETQIDAVRPNPTAVGTDIFYTLGRETRLSSIGIYDATGRRIRDLDLRDARPGRFRTYWDLLDDGGRAVPSGVYWARIRGGSSIRGARLMVLR